MTPAHRVACPVLSALLLAAPACTGKAAAPVEDGGAAEKVERLEILDRSIAFHGAEAWLHSAVAFTISSLSGDFRVEARRDGDRFDERVSREQDGRLSAYRHRNDASGTQTVEQWHGGEAVELDDEARQRVRDYVSQRVYFVFLPFRFNDPNTYKQDLGIEHWSGRKLHKVKLTFEPGTSSSADSEFMLWFDPESAQLEQFAYSHSGGLRFRPLLNYRRIGGILFFDQENYAMDRQESVDLLTASFVEEEMELLSVVRLDEIEVRAIE